MVFRMLYISSRQTHYKFPNLILLTNSSFFTSYKIKTPVTGDRGAYEIVIDIKGAVIQPPRVPRRNIRHNIQCANTRLPIQTLHRKRTLFHLCTRYIVRIAYVFTSLSDMGFASVGKEIASFKPTFRYAYIIFSCQSQVFLILFCPTSPQVNQWKLGLFTSLPLLFLRILIGGLK